MIAALVIGFVGSLHCVGMCGPLNILMLSRKKSVIGFLLYHLGRISVYILLGIILGAIGHSLQLFKVQQIVTFGMGAALLILYGIPGFRNRLEKTYYQSRFYQFIQKLLVRNLSTRRRWLASGMANGFLPCGLTYVAAAGAVVLGSTWDGVFYMALFGLGTLPAISLLSLGIISSIRLQRLIPRSISFIAVLSGGLLILRGFLMTSPNFNQLVQAKAAGLITVCGL